MKKIYLILTFIFLSFYFLFIFKNEIFACMSDRDCGSGSYCYNFNRNEGVCRRNGGGGGGGTTLPTVTPVPTCVPRPACLDAHPACKIPVTTNMCPPTPTPTPTIIAGDANGDGKVNFMDYFYYVQAKFGGGLPTGVNVDFNKDNAVNDSDRQILIPLLRAILGI